MRTRSMTLVAAVVAASLWMIDALPAAGAEVQQHSGTVVTKDDGVIRLAEIGPWQVRDHETVVTYRTISVTPSTTFALARRDERPTSGFPGDWVVEAAEAWDLLEGDYVTVDCLHEAGRMIALRITIVEPD